MDTLNVQFIDTTQATICSYFASPQSPDDFPNLGTVETSDARWITYYDQQGAQLQQYLPAPTSS